MDLLRWFRFLWSGIGVPWDRAPRIEARDFCRWLQVSGKQSRPHWRAQAEGGVPAPAPAGEAYAPSARAGFISPSPGVRDEQRPLSIPPVRDRIVQAALKIVLEPVFEADFLPVSFGFRPRRSAHDALQVLIDECWRGRRWVVETDIANGLTRVSLESSFGVRDNVPCRIACAL
jgi:hypothetical protein